MNSRDKGAGRKRNAERKIRGSPVSLFSISLAASAILCLSSPTSDFLLNSAFVGEISAAIFRLPPPPPTLVGLLRDEGVLLKHDCENEEAEEHANWSPLIELTTIFAFLGLPTVKIELRKLAR
ncbi:hypothetical protein NL676_012133 [Syzygium grande]|nr:hypothetical protein NL676_012133 [Syzygium grande]